MRSAIKQVASGRFGVTAEYLVNADDLQIKMAQGAKPGEGGQLPGYKVDKTIAAVRHATPGVGLISRAASRHLFHRGPQAAHPRSEERQSGRPHLGEAGFRGGRWDVAAGVAKCRADHLTISGFEGGTGRAR